MLWACILVNVLISVLEWHVTLAADPLVGIFFQINSSSCRGIDYNLCYQILSHLIFYCIRKIELRYYCMTKHYLGNWKQTLFENIATTQPVKAG